MVIMMGKKSFYTRHSMAGLQPALLLLFLLFMFSLNAEAKDNTVRVAYFDLGNYYQPNADGSVESYDSAYLDMIAEYTGYQFEYVDCKTWEQALSMLENHEIDLVGTMQRTPEREEKYSLCSTYYGFAVAELAALASSDYIYEDYAQISGSTIGYIKDYVVYDYVQQLMAEHHFTAKLVAYDNQTALDNALESGEIDLIAANAHAMHDDWKIIEKFSYAPFYFASWKGNETLTKEINDALIKINLYQEDFDDRLISQYFSKMVNSPYNKEELNCIAEKKVYTIYFDECTRPLAWYDEKTDSMEGILIDICTELSLTTGLQFQILPESEKGSSNLERSVVYNIFSSNANESYVGLDGKTGSILNQEFFLYHRSGEPFDSNTSVSYRVAIPKGRNGCSAYLKEQFPNYTLTEYATPAECITHVLNNDADLAFLSSYVADCILITEDIDNIVSIPTTSTIVEIGLIFHGEDAELLADIVNKGYRLIEPETINNIKLRYLSSIVPNASLSYFIRNHALEAFVIIFAFVLSLTAIISLIFYTKIIRAKNQKILEADRAKMDFFSRMSHDMRTPMNGILGMARLSKNEQDIEMMHHNMQMVEESGTYMLSLINDTLDLQKIETGKMQLHPETVSSKAFFESISEMARATARQKDITLQTELYPALHSRYIQIDPVRLKQVFSNLLSNAIKFTPAGGLVKFTAKKLDGDDSHTYMEFQIQDTGIGMSEQFMKNDIFTAYSQEHNSITKQQTGSGLGLAITKNLLELMNGTIEVESTPGEGSTFSVYLDINNVDIDDAEFQLSESQNHIDSIIRQLRNKRILVCEDHPLNAEIARRILEKAGCQVTWADDGCVGVKAFQDSEPFYFHAILMDIRMPVMNGLQAAQAIRAMQRPDAFCVPIIAMTANAYEEDIRLSAQAGMNAHLAKPVEPDTLYEVLARQINATP